MCKKFVASLNAGTFQYRFRIHLCSAGYPLLMSRMLHLKCCTYTGCSS